MSDYWPDTISDDDECPEQIYSEEKIAAAPEKEGAALPVKTNTFYLRVKVAQGAACTFSFSADGKNFTPVGGDLHRQAGSLDRLHHRPLRRPRGHGARSGYADFHWFRVE